MFTQVCLGEWVGGGGWREGRDEGQKSCHSVSHAHTNAAIHPGQLITPANNERATQRDKRETNFGRELHALRVCVSVLSVSVCGGETSMKSE